MFGSALIALPLTYLFVVNITLLVLGPIIVLAMLLLTIFTAKKQRTAEGRPAPGARSGGIKGLILALLGWARFWITLAVAALVHVVLCIAYINLNPFVRGLLCAPFRC